MIEHQKYEFCMAIKCQDLVKDKCVLGDDYHSFCCATAKEFHHWLKENGYKILKVENASYIFSKDEGE